MRSSILWLILDVIISWAIELVFFKEESARDFQDRQRPLTRISGEQLNLVLYFVFSISRRLFHRRIHSLRLLLPLFTQRERHKSKTHTFGHK